MNPERRRLGRPANPLAAPVRRWGLRVGWYPGGYVTGDPKDRKMRRFPDEARAAAFLKRKEAELMALRPSEARLAAWNDDPTVAEVIDACRVHLARGNTATYLRLDSSYRNWVGPTVGGNTRAELCPELFVAPISAKLGCGGDPKAERTALAVLTRFAVAAGIWPPNPWGPAEVLARQVQAAYRHAARRAADMRAAELGPFGPHPPHPTPDRVRQVPDWYRVDALAGNVVAWQTAGRAACEYCSDARSRRLLAEGPAHQHAESIRCLAALGTRIAELLALHSSDIDRVTGRVSITRQLDRYRSWTGVAPPVLAPKGGRTRMTACLAFHLPRLLEAAEYADRHTHGWLFPPTRGQRAWLAAWSTSFRSGVQLMNHRRAHAIECGIPDDEAPPEWV